MRSRVEMKATAKQNFARSFSVFLLAALILSMASSVCVVPLVLALPNTQARQTLANDYNKLLAKGSAVTQKDATQFVDEAYQIIGGARGVMTFRLAGLLTLVLFMGVYVIRIGLSSLALVADKNERLGFKGFFSHLKHFGRWIGFLVVIVIRIALWSLLFGVGGVVAWYRYRQARYLLLENPALGINEALRLSGELMRGYKGRLFVLDISFIVWYLAELLIAYYLTYNFLDLFVVPYRELTNVQFYHDVRREHPVEGLGPMMAFAVETPPAPVPPQPPTNPPF